MKTRICFSFMNMAQ
ncbi:unnamed protein product [Acanthoscelides obtectus]|uniref:Uncharacterized protein n=1 Tax=Acanthoscelides obtectus TaxID=200917 RepID=A0A9P0KQR9_ACAOB|nr:unnamed protein product [Acanthoscelides obtectus]CAK1638204.1 hypothetical protein AOBTE_LOCUS10451 [Acanthoscelides obtectus]